MNHIQVPGGPRLSVRELESRDVPCIVRYWAEATPQDLARMGVDPTLLPTPEQMTAGIHAALALPLEQRKAFSVVWERDGRAIGVVTLKRIQPGEEADIHLHVWEPTERRKGHGRLLFAMAALQCLQRYRLKRIACEPSSANPQPNGMLRALGIPCVRTYRTRSSELTFEAEVNRYEMDEALLRESFSRALEAYSTSKSKKVEG